MRICLMFLLLCLCGMPVVAQETGNQTANSAAGSGAIDVQTATEALGPLVDRVLGVRATEVPGLWVVDIEKDGQKVPIFLDSSGKYLISGNVIRLADMVNLTQKYHSELNQVDVSRIPLEDALLLGKATATTKVIVFTDPQCPFCGKLHKELEKVVERDPQIAFLIKMFPLKMHPEAYDISRSIVCAQSMELLERAFAGQPVPEATCDTKAVDATLNLVQQLGIRSTPTLVLEDGRVVPGFKEADELLRMLGSSK